MKTERNMNIPTISVDMMVNKLGGLYISAIKGGLPVKEIPSAFLWGAPGVGKSDGVRQIAEKIKAETGKKTCVTDIRLLLFSPIDLRGVPMADHSRHFTEWLRPKIFDLDPVSFSDNVPYCPGLRFPLFQHTTLITNHFVVVSHGREIFFSEFSRNVFIAWTIGI